jgi:hypothetical protein
MKAINIHEQFLYRKDDGAILETFLEKKENVPRVLKMDARLNTSGITD